MAFVALTSLIATIELEFLQPIPRVSLNDEKAMKTLFENLSSLQAFLQSGAPIRDLEIKIRDFALKTEDAIEMKLRSILLGKKYVHKALEELHKTLREVSEESLKIINNTASTEPPEPASHPVNVVLGGRSSPLSPNLEDQFNEEAFNAVRDLLFRSCDRENVVSIVGMPGIGKTTLARRVYDSEDAKRYTIRAWVTVPQEYKSRHVILDVIHLTRRNIKKRITTLSQLKEELFNHLEGETRYFIVLDNIPSTTQAWDDIKACLPNVSYQIRILLTTQFNKVGRYAAPKRNVHEMRVLDSNESWDLFCKKLSFKEPTRAPEFEEIGKRVVEECEGLPRSIVAVAKRLSKCNYTLREWKKIEKEVDSLGPLYNDAEHLSKLTLVYNQFPQHLKVCFLHFAIYPKRFKINVKGLIRVWIAEGFVGPLGHEELEKEGYCYLDELVRNGVVSISKWEYKMTNVCWMHSSLRDFCIGEAKKEGLLCAVNTRQYLGLSLDMFANSCRWLSLYPHKLDYYTFFSSNNPRSLFFFQGDSQVLVFFKLLRIVDINSLQIPKRVPLDLRGLVFLRYLSVPQRFEGLDDVVSNNWNLQTLIIFGTGVESQLRTPTGHLSSKIWDLPHLRHLELGNFYTVDPPSMVKEQLQTLSWVSPTHFTKEVYCSFSNLKYLKVFYKDAFESGRNNPNIISLDYIEYLSKLETLTIIVPMGSVTRVERAIFPAKLKKLRLSETNLPVKVLEDFWQFSMIKVLKLDNAFNGRVWKPSATLNSLKVLLIEARNMEQLARLLI